MPLSDFDGTTPHHGITKHCGDKPPHSIRGQSQGLIPYWMDEERVEDSSSLSFFCFSSQKE